MKIWNAAAALARTVVAGVVAMAAVVATAATNVGGTIAANTTWTLANAPYTVTADVTVDGGATLTVEPGVTVFMTAGTNLIVKSGGLVAQGTAGTPIVVTSYRDVASPVPPPASGDWGQLQFLSGTVAANARLNYVDVKYGRGIVILGAAPTLDNVSSNHHVGAAIGIDLAASPRGKGLRASGNTLNGIAVPAGDIQGDVVWALTGIPYVVAEGVVGVGAPAAPLTLSMPASLTVAPGNSAPLAITLATPAAAGGITVNLASSNAAAATVPPTASIAAGATSTTVDVTGVAVGDATITAAATGYTPANTAVAVRNITIDVAPGGAIEVPKGVTQTYRATLSQASPVAITVAVATGAAGIATVSPTSLVFAANQTSVAFDVTGVNSGSTTLSLTAAGLATKTVNVTVLGQGSVAFTRTAVTIGKRLEIPAGISNYKVELRAGGVPFVTPVPVTVTLAASDATKVLIPASVIIPAQSATQSLSIRGLELTAAPVAITASTAGYASGTPLEATVVVPQLAITGLDGARTTFDARDEFGLSWVVADAGNPIQAAWVDTPVDLAISNASPPGIVPGFFDSLTGGTAITQAVIAAGANARSVAGFVERPTAAGSYAVTASVTGLTTVTSATQTVTAPTLQLPAGVRIGIGLTSLGNAVEVTRTGDLAAPLTVTLSCAPTAVCSVPASVVIPATAASAAVPVTGVAAGMATLTASSTGYTTGTSAVTAETPGITIASSAASTVIGGTIDLTLTLGGTGQVAAVAPANVVLTLTSSAPTVASVPSTATIAAGSTSVGGVQVRGLAPGTPSITAASPGFAAKTAGPLTVLDNRLQLAPATASVSAGGTLPMTVSIADASFTAQSSMAVSLASSNAALVSVPATVTIARYATSAAFNATGVANGTATITAQAVGMIDATATITTGSQALSLPTTSLVAIGRQRAITVTLSSPAPAGGLVVNLVSASPAVVSVPSSVMVASGTTTATFNVTGVANGIQNVTASAVGATSATTQVSVNAFTLNFVPASGARIELPQGVTQTWEVGLHHGGGCCYTLPENMVVTVESGDSAVASFAATALTIPKGQTRAPITLSGLATGTTMVTLSAPGLPPAVIPTAILEQGRLVFTPETAIVGNGWVGSPLLQLFAGGTPYATRIPVAITLQNPNPTHVGAPATVTVPAGSSGVYVSVTALDDVGSPFTIQATESTGFSPGELAVNVSPPQLSLFSLDGKRIQNGGRDRFYVALNAPASANVTQQPVTLPKVDLSITSPIPAGIVGGFYDQQTAGSAITQVQILGNGQAQAFVGQPTAAGSYAVTASIAGVTSVTSAVQTVAQGTLVMTPTTHKVGKGLVLGTYISRYLNGEAFASEDPVTVSLTSSDPTRVTVPPSVTINANSGSAALSITGVEVTATPVTVTASAPGYAPMQFTVSVVAPQLQVYGLDDVRTMNSARDSFGFGWYVPQDVGYGAYQVSSADIDVAVSISGASPAGLIPGIYSAPEGGTPTTTIRIGAGQNSSGQVYVGTPTAATGSYTVSLNAAGIASAASALQTVTDAQPVVDIFGYPQIVLGAGMKPASWTDLAVERRVLGRPYYGRDDAEVTVTSTDASMASFPDVVYIPAGEAAAAFPMTGVYPGSALMTLTATGYGAGPAHEVAVVTPELQISLYSDPAEVAVDGVLDFALEIFVRDGYPWSQVLTTDAYVDLTSSDPSIGSVTVPYAYIPAEQYNAYLQVMGLAPGSFMIQAYGNSGPVTGAYATSPTITVTP